GVDIFVGINGPYTTNPTTAVGLEVTNVTFALALLRSADGTQSFYALKTTGGPADLVGVPGVTATVTNFEADVNGSSVANLAVDFTKFAGGGLSIPGSGMSLTFATPTLFATGHLHIEIAGASLDVDATFQEITDGTGANTIQVAVQN